MEEGDWYLKVGQLENKKRVGGIESKWQAEV